MGASEFTGTTHCASLIRLSWCFVSKQEMIEGSEQRYEAFIGQYTQQVLNSILQLLRAPTWLSDRDRCITIAERIQEQIARDTARGKKSAKDDALWKDILNLHEDLQEFLVSMLREPFTTLASDEWRERLREAVHAHPPPVPVERPKALRGPRQSQPDSPSSSSVAKAKAKAKQPRAITYDEDGKEKRPVGRPPNPPNMKRLAPIAPVKVTPRQTHKLNENRLAPPSPSRFHGIMSSPPAKRPTSSTSSSASVPPSSIDQPFAGLWSDLTAILQSGRYYPLCTATSPAIPSVKSSGSDDDNDDTMATQTSAAAEANKSSWGYSPTDWGRIAWPQAPPAITIATASVASCDSKCTPLIASWSTHQLVPPLPPKKSTTVTAINTNDNKDAASLPEAALSYDASSKRKRQFVDTEFDDDDDNDGNGSDNDGDSMAMQEGGDDNNNDDASSVSSTISSSTSPAAVSSNIAAMSMKAALAAAMEASQKMIYDQHVTASLTTKREEKERLSIAAHKQLAELAAPAKRTSKKAALAAKEAQMSSLLTPVVNGIQAVVAPVRSALHGARQQSAAYLPPPSLPEKSQFATQLMPRSSMVTAPSNETHEAALQQIASSRAGSRSAADAKMAQLKENKKKREAAMKKQEEKERKMMDKMKDMTEAQKVVFLQQQLAKEKKKQMTKAKTSTGPSTPTKRGTAVTTISGALGAAPKAKDVRALPAAIFESDPYLETLRMKANADHNVDLLALAADAKPKTCSICRALGVISVSHISTSTRHHSKEDRIRVMALVAAVQSNPVLTSGARKRGRPPKPKPVQDDEEAEVNDDDNGNGDGDNDNDEDEDIAPPIKKRRKQIASDDDNDDDMEREGEGDDGEGDDVKPKRTIVKHEVKVKQQPKGTSSSSVKKERIADVTATALAAAKAALAAAAASSSTSSPSKGQASSWNDHDDRELLVAVRDLGVQWSAISKRLSSHHTDTDVKQRFLGVLQRRYPIHGVQDHDGIDDAIAQLDTIMATNDDAKKKQVSSILVEAALETAFKEAEDHANRVAAAAKKAPAPRRKPGSANGNNKAAATTATPAAASSTTAAASASSQLTAGGYKKHSTMTKEEKKERRDARKRKKKNKSQRAKKEDMKTRAPAKRAAAIAANKKLATQSKSKSDDDNEEEDIKEENDGKEADDAKDGDESEVDMKKNNSKKSLKAAGKAKAVSDDEATEDDDDENVPLSSRAAVVAANRKDAKSPSPPPTIPPIVTDAPPAAAATTTSTDDQSSTNTKDDSTSGSSTSGDADKKHDDDGGDEVEYDSDVDSVPSDDYDDDDDGTIAGDDGDDDNDGVMQPLFKPFVPPTIDSGHTIAAAAVPLDQLNAPQSLSNGVSSSNGDGSGGMVDDKEAKEIRDIKEASSYIVADSSIAAAQRELNAQIFVNGWHTINIRQYSAANNDGSDGMIIPLRYKVDGGITWWVVRPFFDLQNTRGNATQFMKALTKYNIGRKISGSSPTETDPAWCIQSRYTPLLINGRSSRVHQAYAIKMLSYIIPAVDHSDDVKHMDWSHDGINALRAQFGKSSTDNTNDGGRQRGERGGRHRGSMTQKLDREAQRAIARGEKPRRRLDPVERKRRQDKKERYEANKKKRHDEQMARKEAEKELVKECKFWQNGACSKGTDCPFRHIGTPSRKTELCTYWAKNSCMKGDMCFFSHDYKTVPCQFFHLSKCTDRLCRFSHEPITDEARDKLRKSIEDKREKDNEKRAAHAAITAAKTALTSVNAAAADGGAPVITIKPLPSALSMRGMSEKEKAQARAAVIAENAAVARETALLESNPFASAFGNDMASDTATAMPIMDDSSRAHDGSVEQPPSLSSHES